MIILHFYEIENIQKNNFDIYETFHLQDTWDTRT